MKKDDRNAADGWDLHDRSQLRDFRSLSLRRKMEAVEGMADLVRRFDKLRANGAFHAALPDAGRSGAPAVVRERPAGYHTPRCVIPLPGCTSEPLMAYLKALGVLRLVSEQKDTAARGWWKNDTFCLRSSLGRDALLEFFLEEYSPSPIVAPWAGGSGFFRKDNKKAVEELSKGQSPRVRDYAHVIEKVHAILEDENVGDKPHDEDKVRLIRRFRRELPDDVVTWMDAAMVLQQDGQSFAPLLGTGGNDGRLDFTQNFMQRIVTLGLHKLDYADNKSQEWLEQALFTSPAKLGKASVGQFSPGRAGGPNATQGMEGNSIDNPWDFIFMLEGTLMFAGAAVRRLGVGSSGRAVFPFTVRAVAAGFDSPASGDEAESRGELWLPLWGRPANMAELHRLFSEGRAEISGSPARDGVDFARAVAGLGVDRGLAGFNRFAFLKRSGKAFLAAPLGRFEVIDRSSVDLLREADGWIDRFRRASGDRAAPPRFASALRRIDSAVFAFCKHGGAPLFQEIVVALGTAERALVASERFRNEKGLRPLAGLSTAWIKAADDGSLEFTVARALASVHDPEGRIGPLRANIESVDWKKMCRSWAEKDRTVVWNAADLATNMVDIFQRRLLDGARAGCERLPLASRFAVSLDTVARFIDGSLDDQRIENLVWGLMPVKGMRTGGYGQKGRAGTLPTPAYALLKLLFLPQSLVIDREKDGSSFVRPLRDGERGGVLIRPEPSVLPLLRGGRLGEACVIAARRLRASGLNPMPGPLRGRGVRDGEWRELDHMGKAAVDPMRLAAALLIPIRNNAVSSLARLVLSGNDTNYGQNRKDVITNHEGGTLP